jgi:hypothetical protein
MTETDKIKAKIKKLFALSKSPNANEAAAALEMAQKLMEEYGLIKSDIPALDVNEGESPRAGGNTPPQYEIKLAVSIARAFGCQVINSRNLGKDLVYRNAYQFIGVDYRPEVASYIATVLFRKLRRARTDYIKSLYRVRSRITKIKRGDEFSRGWVSTVIAKLNAFSVPEEELMAVELYMKNRYPHLESISGINRGSVKKYEYADWHYGREAGSGVEIQHGLKGQAGTRLLEA